MFCSQFNNSEIDWDADYSDDDYDAVPINEKEFWGYLEKLEESNLFEMKQLQDLKQTLEKVEQESADTIAAKRSKVVELDSNIKQLKDSMKGRQDRLTYFKGMLSSDN